jgi:hypothetical protein
LCIDLQDQTGIYGATSQTGHKKNTKGRHPASPGALMPNAMASKNPYADRRSHIPAPDDSNLGFYLAAAFGLAITMPAIPMISSRTPAPKPP